ncbi:MAG: hypothetical protein RL490_386 [Pseudomonadota bacterium]
MECLAVQAMLKRNLIQNRADRISGIGRIAFALPALAAALIDPPQPASNAPVVVQLLLAYALLAIALGLVTWRRSLSAPPIGQWAHAVDLLVVAALVYLTSGATSPFFPLYLFATLSATLRWNWRGALGTSLAIVLLFIPTAFITAGGLDPQTDDVLRYVVRIGQIIVVGGLLAYMGAQRERVWQELLGLARPVDGSAGSINDAIGLSLRHVSDFFAVPRAIFIWEMRDGDGWQAMAGSHVSHMLSLPPGCMLPVKAIAAGIAFDYRAGARGCQRYDADGSLTNVDHPLLDTGLAEQWTIAEAAVAAVRCDALSGWLIIPKPVTEEDLYLARALAVQIAATLDQAGATETLRAAAASEERIRVAHDLHDGILQFLAGLSLQLKLIARANGHDSAAVAERVDRLQTALRGEQRDLRAFITAIRPRALPGGDNLETLVAGLAQQWNIAIDASQAMAPPPELAADTRQIVREAVANAVRHGGADRISMTGSSGVAGYRLAIADNGRGFPHQGRFSDSALRARGDGPRSILARVGRLGGRLQLETTAGRTTLQIDLPLPTTSQPTTSLPEKTLP